MAKKATWRPPDIGYLKGHAYKGLTELRWKSGHVPHRIIGFRAAERDFVMLVGCTHNSQKYDPPAALDTAVARRKNIDRGEAMTCEYPLLVGS
jgi:hypothetical protein